MAASPKVPVNASVASLIIDATGSQLAATVVDNGNNTNSLLTGLVANGSQVSTGNPLPVNATVNASIAPFAPTGQAALNATTTSSNVAFGSSGTTALITNNGSVTAYLNFGTSNAVTATTNGYPLNAGQSIAYSVTGYTYVAAITSSSTAALAITTGSGLPAIADSGGASGGTASSVTIADGITSSTKATVSAIHQADQQSVPSTSNALTTAGVSQLQTITGNVVDRMRETGLDNQSALGVAAGATQLAMQFKTSSANTYSSGVTSIVVAATSGAIGGVPWTIKQGTYLQLDTGTNQENVLVASVSGTTVTLVAATTKAHTATFPVIGFTLNQERDATGEQDSATGAGGTPAFEMEFNGGAPDGTNYDRGRNAQGKSKTTYTISSGGTAGSTSLTLSSAPPATGVGSLQPGNKVLLITASFPTVGQFETVNIDLSYVAGSATVPLSSAIVNSLPYTSLVVDSHNSLGATNTGGTLIGVEAELGHLVDLVGGYIWPEISFTKDSAPGTNVGFDGIGIYNASTGFVDRARAITGSQGTLAVGLANVSNSAGLPTTSANGTIADGSGSITTGGTSQQVFAANTTRQYLFLQNNSTGTLWFNYGTAAVQNQPSIMLAAGQFYETGPFVSNQTINIIGATTAQAFTAKQA